MLYPARHVLQPAWPAPVEELIIYAPDGHATSRVLAPAGQARSDGAERVMVRTRPLNATVLETRDQVRYGYLVGLRDARTGEPIVDHELLASAWLETDAVPAGSIVLFEGGEGEYGDIASAEIRRIYRPNRLDFGQRLRLAGRLLIDRWRSHSAQKA